SAARARRYAGPEMAERAREGVTALLIERAAGPTRSFLDDRHWDRTGLRVLRGGNKQCFHDLLHQRRDAVDGAAPGARSAAGWSAQSVSEIRSIVTASPWP